MYITGASFWELDGKQAYDYFSQVDGSLWDGNNDGTKKRQQYAAKSYAGELLPINKIICKADELYQKCAGLGKLDEIQWYAYQAHLQCYPPMRTVEVAPVITDTPTPLNH